MSRSTKIVGGVVLAVCVPIGAYAAWYTYHRQAVIAEVARCNDALTHPTQSTLVPLAPGVPPVPATLAKPCLLQAIPPTFIDLLRGRTAPSGIPPRMKVNSSSLWNVLVGRYPLVPDINLRCDQSATTTDCNALPLMP